MQYLESDLILISQLGCLESEHGLEHVRSGRGAHYLREQVAFYAYRCSIKSEFWREGQEEYLVIVVDHAWGHIHCVG